MKWGEGGGIDRDGAGKRRKQKSLFLPPPPISITALGASIAPPPPPFLPVRDSNCCHGMRPCFALVLIVLLRWAYTASPPFQELPPRRSSMPSDWPVQACHKIIGTPPPPLMTLFSAHSLPPQQFSFYEVRLLHFPPFLFLSCVSVDDDDCEWAGEHAKREKAGKRLPPPPLPQPQEPVFHSY